MKTLSFKIENTKVGDLNNPLVHDLDAIAGGTVTEVKALNVVKLDDVYSMVTVSVTVSVPDPS